MKTTTTKTPGLEIAAAIKANAERYHAFEISHAQFSAINKALWDKALALGISRELAARLSK